MNSIVPLPLGLLCSTRLLEEMHKSPVNVRYYYAGKMLIIHYFTVRMRRYETLRRVRPLILTLGGWSSYPLPLDMTVMKVLGSMGPDLELRKEW